MTKPTPEERGSIAYRDNLERECGRLSAQLAESERRIKRLREGIATALAHSNPRLIYLALAEAIEADDRQETKVEPSDRADRMLRIDGPEPAPFGKQRRQFEPLPPTAERPPEAGEPSEEEIEAIWVDCGGCDDNWNGERALWRNGYQRGHCVGFNAGRASEAAAHDATKQELAELRALYNGNAMKQELERVRGELANVQGLLDKRTAQRNDLREGREEPTDEALASALQSAWNESLDDDWSGHVAQARAAKSLLLGVRPRVNREKLAKFLAWKFAASKMSASVAGPDPDSFWPCTNLRNRGEWLAIADAVLALITGPAVDRKDSKPAAVPLSGEEGSWNAVAPGVEKTGPRKGETEAPSPLPEPPWNYDAPPDSEIGQWHELLPTNDSDGRRFAHATPLAYQGRTEWHGSGGYTRTRISVKAWRRAQQQPAVTPGPTILEKQVCDLQGGLNSVADRVARLESLDARLREVELQGRVTLGMLSLLWAYVPGAPSIAEEGVRIAREERERG